MKKLIVLLLALIFTVHSFGQKKEDKSVKITDMGYSITDFYHKNIIFRDTVKFPLDFPWQSFADAVFKDGKYTVDSIPENVKIIINGIYFKDKKILSKVNDYQILMVKKDSVLNYIYDNVKKQLVSTNKYVKQPSMVYQNHQNLPRDFFFFKQYTLEPIRYSCSSYSPVLDVFLTEDSIVPYAKPRVMVDGRLQPKAFDYQNIDLENVKQIDVFADRKSVV